MRQTRAFRLSVVGAVAALAAALVAAIDLIGQQARLVHIITIFCGGMAGGASLARLVFEARARRGDARADLGGRSGAGFRHSETDPEDSRH